MEQNKNTLIKLILALNRMVGQYNFSLLDHHSNVAYIASAIAKELRLSPLEIQHIVIAGALHDIGLLSFCEHENFQILEERHPSSHSLTMFLLFGAIRYFEVPALIVRHHHVNYDEVQRYEQDLEPEDYRIRIPLGSYILRVADRVGVALTFHKNKFILHRLEEDVKPYVERIRSVFHPEVYEVIHRLFRRDYLWLELNSSPPEDLLLQTLTEHIVTEPLDNFFKEIAEVIGYLIDFKSAYTAGHSHAVACVSKWVSEVLNLEFDCKCDMEITGLLHDIGKLAIPLSILEKPGKLTDEEWRVMRSHAYYTHSALEPVYDQYPYLQNGCLHHEKLDGSGYPFGLSREEIPNCAQLLTVADIFSALTEERPYRGRMSNEEVARILGDLARNDKVNWEYVDVILSYFEEILEVRVETEEKARRKYKEFRDRLRQIQELDRKTV